MTSYEDALKALEPCPFCGGAVKMAHMDIVCTGCSLTARFAICSVTSHATRLWNTRSAAPPPPAASPVPRKREDASRDSRI
jgi:tRNA(Arg) A34 adenosine deaminase TadA